MPALQKIMVEFARENERSELTGELIGDTLDDALADDGDAEAEDKIVSQVRIWVPRSRGALHRSRFSRQQQIRSFSPYTRAGRCHVPGCFVSALL